MTIVWTCECGQKNRSHDLKEMVCGNCGKKVENPMAIYWEMKPNEPDPRHLC